MLLMKFVGCETVFTNQRELTKGVTQNYLVSVVKLEGFFFIFHAGYLKL